MSERAAARQVGKEKAAAARAAAEQAAAKHVAADSGFSCSLVRAGGKDPLYTFDGFSMAVQISFQSQIHNCMVGWGFAAQSRRASAAR